MITYKFWQSEKKSICYTHRTTWEGWFLFAIIPVYVRMVKKERF